jgi:hypothetical protein
MHSEDAMTADRPAGEVLRYLTPDLRETLANLHGAPRSVAEATVQLLPFGSRAALEAVEPPLAVAGGDPGGGERHRPLTLTPFAYEVIAAAAAAADADPAGVDEWTLRAERAAQRARDRAQRGPR